MRLLTPSAKDWSQKFLQRKKEREKERKREKEIFEKLSV